MANNVYMRSYRRALWLYPIFQIPLICLGVCLITAALFWLLKFGRPQVAVAIALDLSLSTYGGQTELFNAPGTVLNQEVQAVEAYLKQNNGAVLRRPNQVKVFGFGEKIVPLTENFDNNSGKVKQELLQNLKRDGLAQAIIPDRTNIDLAIKTGIDALKTVPDSCRELILVTDGIDGQAQISPFLITEALINQIKINSVVVGQEASELKTAAMSTRGQYLSGNIDSLSTFFADDFFDLFNSNLRWIIFWLGLAWISLMWVLVLPLDRWVFQGIFNMTIDISGRLALSHALFWTALTLVLLWTGRRIPFLSGC